MGLYTFNLCKADGIAGSLEAIELRDDGEAYARAGELLERHLTCDHVDAWHGDRPVVARHRSQPVIRPVDAVA